MENGVRALLKQAGLKLGTPGRRDVPVRVRELSAGDSVLRALVESLLGATQAMNTQVEALIRQMLNEVRTEPVCQRLMGVPGVSPLTVLAFRATLDRPDRFRRSRDVGAHLGDVDT